MKKKYSFKSKIIFVKKVIPLNLLLFFYMLVMSQSLVAQQTYTFTHCGATGSVGPTQAQVNTSYTMTNLSGSVVAIGGVQSWTVVNTGLYLIDVRGASGGDRTGSPNRFGGYGASMIGEFNLVQGDVIRIIVGQKGVDGAATGSGGGGSFVTRNNALLIAAGGGGGATGDQSAASATIGMNGTNDFPGGAILGGVNGGGGQVCNNSGTNHGGGGGGYIGNGATSSLGNASGGGLSYTNGGTGGATAGNPGAFGGGGGATGAGPTLFGGGGGGGGYSGGAGGQQVNHCLNGISRSGGGGGGSYNSGVNQVNSVLTATSNGRVIIQELCNISLTASGNNSLNPSICSGQSVTLTTNAVSNYSWSNGNTTNSVIVVTPTSTTVYTLSATSVSNCTAYNSLTVIVSGAVPLLSIVTSTNQTCLGKTATLTASGAVTYTWTNGVVNGVSFLPQSTTAYTVTGENGCGTSTAVSTISVNPLPVSIVSTHTAVCANKNATLSVTAAATSYTWEPGNIINSNPNLVVNPQANTVYTITASNGTCVNVTTISIQSNPVPTINAITISTIICPGSSIALSVTGGNNYTWTPGNQNGNSIVVNPTISTLYNVVGDNAFGCIGTAQQVIVVGTPPTVTVSSSDYTICIGNSSTLSATGANNYVWINGPTTTSYVVTPNMTTTYTVDGMDTNNPCVATRTVEITVITPVLTISGNTTICSGETTSLTGSGVTSYTWANPGPPGAITYVAPTTNTSYTLNATETVNNINCPVSAVVNVVVNPKPTLNVVPTLSITCPKYTNTLTASGASTYSWINQTSTVVTGTSITFVSNIPILLVYTVTGISAQGCEANIIYPINIPVCEIYNSIEMFNANKLISVYPNPSNGEFVISAEKDMSLRVINELGQVIKQIQVSDKSNYKVSISNLSNGIYFIVGDGVNKKIVLNK